MAEHIQQVRLPKTSRTIEHVLQPIEAEHVMVACDFLYEHGFEEVASFLRFVSGLEPRRVRPIEPNYERR